MDPLNKNTLQKSVKACPLPSFPGLAVTSAKPIPTRQWIPRYRVSLYFLIVSVAGVLFVIIALFVPPLVWVQEGSTGSSTYYITVMLSIFYTPIPFFVNIILGLIPISLIPLVERNSSRLRLTGAAIFAFLFASAFLIENIQMGIISDAVWQAYGQPMYFTPFISNPWFFMQMVAVILVGISLGSTILSMLSGFFGEYIWTSLKGPFHVDGTRRTAVVIKGGDRGTVLTFDHTTRRTPVTIKGTRGSVLSVNLKGGYLRGQVRPSKWQAYDRED